jgi:acetyl esterase/lipase
VAIRDLFASAPDGHQLRIRLYAPLGDRNSGGAMLWIHGGGFIIGSPEQDQNQLIALCLDLGITIAAVAYRYAPSHPHPVPVEDCYAGLAWLHHHSAELGVDPSRIAIGGNSAGGGLAAGLVLLAHDRGKYPVAFQLLVYPMLDDRTALRRDIDDARLRLWHTRSNRYAWRAYLGQPPGGADVSPYAAPARRHDLSGLPPAWIGVGTCDLFYEEDLAYAARLKDAGVPCELHVVEGAYHGFDLVDVPVARSFRRAITKALGRGLVVV